MLRYSRKLLSQDLLRSWQKILPQKNQYDFRSGLGIENVLYEVIQFLYNELDNRKKVFVFFLDLTNTFDTKHHDSLSQILPSFGITNRSLNWFKSYISNKKQIIVFNDVLSDEEVLEYGVLQGSVLLSIIHNCYFNF